MVASFELRPLLADLVKIEILRLSSVPRIDPFTAEVYLPLAHVDRLLSVQLLPEDYAEIEVSFVGGGSWKGRVWLATEHFEPPEIEFDDHLQPKVAAVMAAFKHEQSRGGTVATQQILSPAQIITTLPPENPALAAVYLSYGDDDLPAARRLYEALEAGNVPVFFRHEHAVPGSHRHRSARKNIREYEHVILLCSERSLSAPSVMSELDEMLSPEFDDGASERIIPVLLDDFTSQGWQPRHPDIRRAVLDRVPLDMKGADLERTKFEKAMKRLLGALKG